MTIEQVIKVVFDGNDYTRNVAQAAEVSGRFDAKVNSVTNSLAALTSGSKQAGLTQLLAAKSGGEFLALLEKQSAKLSARPRLNF
jgi:hypothetical protein